MIYKPYIKDNRTSILFQKWLLNTYKKVLNNYIKDILKIKASKHITAKDYDRILAVLYKYKMPLKLQAMLKREGIKSSIKVRNSLKGRLAVKDVGFYNDLGENIANSAINNSTRLINSVSDRDKKTLRNLQRKLLNGDEVDLNGFINSIPRLSRNRAKLLARDQHQKILSFAAQEAMEASGIDSYIWRTSGDERVRESHAFNDGMRFDFGNPPTETGNPGEDILCRCIAEPIII